MSSSGFLLSLIQFDTLTFTILRYLSWPNKSLHGIANAPREFQRYPNLTRQQLIMNSNRGMTFLLAFVGFVWWPILTFAQQSISSFSEVDIPTFVTSDDNPATVDYWACFSPDGQKFYSVADRVSAGNGICSLFQRQAVKLVRLQKSDWRFLQQERVGQYRIESRLRASEREDFPLIKMDHLIR